MDPIPPIRLDGGLQPVLEEGLNEGGGNGPGVNLRGTTAWAGVDVAKRVRSKPNAEFSLRWNGGW